MSVSLFIKRPGQKIEIVSMAGQGTATVWVGELARKHGFRLFKGTYPVFLNDLGDFETAIAEITIIRNETQTWMNAHQQFNEQDIRSSADRWDRILLRLEQVKNEPDAEVDFG
jgi:hypothetical protein